MIEGVLKVSCHPLDKAVKFRVGYSSDSECLNLVVDHIFDEIRCRLLRGNKPFCAPKIKIHLKVIIINLLLASKYGHDYYVRYSRNKNHYQKSRYNPANLKIDYLILVIDSMVTIGLIGNKLGYRDDKRRYSVYGRRQARMWLTDMGFKLFSEGGLYREKFEIFDNSDVIILRGKKINGSAKNISYRDSMAVKSMRANLVRYNEFISKADISHPSDTCINRRLYRIFNDGLWSKGGRFYGSCFQGMGVVDGDRISSKAYRNDIQINGNHASELDYKSLHPSILYNIENIPVPNDCYTIAGLPRSITKVALQIVINAKDDKSAKKSLQQEIMEQGIFLSGKFTVSDIIDAVKLKHSAISKHFFSSHGLYLQYLDSQVTEGILNYFTNKGIVVLPVHDSYVVEEKYTDELYKAMLTEFKRQFGFDARIERKY